MKEDNAPYTTMIRNKILAEVEKLQVYELASPEFKDGWRFCKEEIIKAIKNVK